MFCKKNILLLALMLNASEFINAQNGIMKKDSTNILTEVVVYANKFPTASKNIVQTIGLITDKTFINQQANSADILTASGQVFVQKSQLGVEVLLLGALKQVEFC